MEKIVSGELPRKPQLYAKEEDNSTMIDQLHIHHETKEPMSNIGSEEGYLSSDNEGAKASSKTKIIRGVVAFFIVFAIVFSTTYVVMVMMGASVKPPSFLVNSLSVSNFNATKTHLKAKWDANFTVVNLDNRLSISIAEVDIFLTFDTYSIASAVSEPLLKLGPKEGGIIRLDMNRKKWRHIKGNPDPFEDIVEARKNGTLAFNLYLIITSTALSGTWWESQMTMFYTCEGLRLRFVSETDGAAVFNFGRMCETGLV